MHHAFVDNFANLNTPVSRLKPKIKVISYFTILILIVFSPARYPLLFLFYSAVVAALILISKVPLWFLLKRMSQVIPFILIISLSSLFREDAGRYFLGCTIKSLLAVSLTLILSSTTKFTDLLEALGRLRIPPIFIQILSFMYRYSFVLEDEFLRTMRAYESRSMGKRNYYRRVGVFSNIIGTIFIHTYERAERIYLAMCARGYDGEESNSD